jgi:hypothetical protein
MTGRSATTAKDRVTEKTGVGAYIQNFDQNDPEPVITKRLLIYLHRISRRRIYLWPIPPQQRKAVDWPINR